MIEYGINLQPIERKEYTKGLIACTHPGKLGDALYSLPTMRHLAKVNEAKIHFYTSKYCMPLLRLMRNQSCIAGAWVEPSYTPNGTRMGVQPYRIPVDVGEYDKVIHLGFRSEPDRRLDHFIAMQVGVSVEHLDAIHYDYEEQETFNEPYIVLAPAGRKQHFILDTLKEFIKICPIPVVQIGASNEGIVSYGDLTGLDMYDTLPWIANSVGFVGLLSSNLVLANGFDIPKVCLVPRKNYKAHHTVQGPQNKYLFRPSAKEILEELGL